MGISLSSCRRTWLQTIDHLAVKVQAGYTGIPLLVTCPFFAASIDCSNLQFSYQYSEPKVLAIKCKEFKPFSPELSNRTSFIQLKVFAQPQQPSSEWLIPLGYSNRFARTHFQTHTSGLLYFKFGLTKGRHEVELNDGQRFWGIGIDLYNPLCSIKWSWREHLLFTLVTCPFQRATEPSLKKQKWFTF